MTEKYSMREILDIKNVNIPDGLLHDQALKYAEYNDNKFASNNF